MAKKKSKILLASIIKNEGPYILEWVAHHKIIGFDNICIVDNESNDGSSQILNRLAKKRQIDSFVFKTPSNVAPQLAVYRKILDKYRDKYDWIFFIDADEFIVPLSDLSLANFFERASCIDDLGAIAFNWALYGSDGWISRPRGLVTEIFESRSSIHNHINRHMKSVVRTKAVKDVSDNPHAFLLADKYQYYNSDLKKVDIDAPEKGLTGGIYWKNFRVNHYVIKSKVEFFGRKRRRGRATLSATIRTKSFFDEHDYNNVFDPFEKEHIIKIQKKIKNLDKLTYADDDSSDKDSRNFLVRLSRDKKYPVTNFSVDECAIEDKNIFIKGWLLDVHPNEQFVVLVNGVEIIFPNFIRVFRDDVRQAQGILRKDNLGFEIKIESDSFKGDLEFIELLYSLKGDTYYEVGSELTPF